MSVYLTSPRRGEVASGSERVRGLRGRPYGSLQPPSLIGRTTSAAGRVRTVL
jgi:hypothetical protein